VKGRGLIVRCDRQVDSVRDLRRHAVEDERRDKANDTLWSLSGQMKKSEAGMETANCAVSYCNTLLISNCESP
jgi:hypothetical protein